MMRVIVRVKDKTKINELEKYGSLVYVSPILNIAGLEINKKNLENLKNDINVSSVEKEHKSTLMLA